MFVYLWVLKHGLSPAAKHITQATEERKTNDFKSALQYTGFLKGVQQQPDNEYYQV